MRCNRTATGCRELFSSINQNLRLREEEFTVELVGKANIGVEQREKWRKWKLLLIYNRLEWGEATDDYVRGKEDFRPLSFQIERKFLNAGVPVRCESMIFRRFSFSTAREAIRGNLLFGH
mgnify:CR=1 FL=1